MSGNGRWFAGDKWALRWNHGINEFVDGATCSPILFDTREAARNYRLRYQHEPVPMPSIVRVRVKVSPL